MEAFERIKYLRKKVLKLSQEEFASKIGISGSNLSNIELGRVGLTDRVSKEICNAYDINEKWLQTGEEPMNKPKSRDEEIFKFFKTIKNTNNVFAKRFILALSKLDVQDWEVLDKLITNYMELSKSDKLNEPINISFNYGKNENYYSLIKKHKKRSSTNSIVYKGGTEYILSKAYAEKFDSDEKDTLPMIAEKPKK